jgi:hypothetical protein
MKNTGTLIQENMKNSKIIIIKQVEGKKFNRGKLLNIGFKEYGESTKYFITHDVDINPSKECVLNYYNQNVNSNVVMGIYTSVHDTLGGIIKIQSSTINKINGFPNDIWGWGAEDKALQNRASFYDIIKQTNMTNNKSYPNLITKFDDINDRDKTNYSHHYYRHYILFDKLRTQEMIKEIYISGINNVEYKILSKQNINNYIEIIEVEV